MKSKILPLAVVLLASFPLLVPSNIKAQNTSDITIGFAPTVEYLVLEPGETYSDKFTVWNLGADTDIYMIEARGFKQVEEYAGTATPLTEEEDKIAPYSASDWVSNLPEDLELVPQKNIDIPYTINVPSDAALGEYSVKLFLVSQTQAEEANTPTFLNLATGPNILIQIGEDSEIEQKASLLNFDTSKHIYDSSDIDFKIEYENLGNTHITPTGDIVITNIFGKRVGSTQFNSDGISVLRDETGIYDQRWTEQFKLLSEEGALMIGPMNAELISTYKTINPGFAPLSAETSFWIIPWKIILAILLGIVAVIVSIVIYAKRRNR